MTPRFWTTPSSARPNLVHRKDADQAICLYPLTDFSPRKHEAWERGYLAGRYGAVRFQRWACTSRSRCTDAMGKDNQAKHRQAARDLKRRAAVRQTV